MKTNKVKTTSKKATVSQEELKQMSDLSDEKNTKAAPKFTLATLKLDGKLGGYTKTVIEDGELATGEDNRAIKEEVKAPSGIILRPRKSFGFIGVDYQLFTNEGGNTPKSMFSVFEKRETKKGFAMNMVYQGTPAQIKEKYPELKMTQVIYFLMEDTNELVRLKVKGMSLGPVFDYWKEFGANEHLFQYYTTLGYVKDKNQFGTFYKSTFKRGEAVEDFTEVKKAMELIDSKIQEIDAYFKERDAQAAIDREFYEKSTAEIDFGTDEEDGKAPSKLGKGPVKVKEGKDGQMEEDEEDDEPSPEATRKMLKKLDEEDEEIDVKKIPFGQPKKKVKDEEEEEDEDDDR